MAQKIRDGDLVFQSHAEDAVFVHGLVGFPVSHALIFKVDDAAVAGDESDPSGHFAFSDRAVHGNVDAGKAFGRESHFGGCSGE